MNRSTLDIQFNGFKACEIIQISQLSEGKVNHAIANTRKNLINIFDKRCAFENKNGVCHQCTELTVKGRAEFVVEKDSFGLTKTLVEMSFAA